MKHTEIPYTIEDKTQIVKGKRLIANTGGWTDNYSSPRLENEANARFIVKCCNDYQLLVDTVRAVVRGSKDWQLTVTNTYRHIEKDGEE